MLLEEERRRFAGGVFKTVPALTPGSSSTSITFCR
jgi:hypothetical protein